MNFLFLSLGMTSTIHVGSRKSDLALVQTRHVCSALEAHWPGVTCAVATMETVGDKVLDRALQKIGDKDLWTKELDVALARGDVAFVVHSLKDLPTVLPHGFVIGAVLQREDPRDAVVFHPKYKDGEASLATLPDGAVLGTSSLRRAAQLARAFPKLKCEVVRGNLNTRLRKLDEDGSRYDALVLAAAGLKRLGWHQRIGQIIDKEVSLYAVGQGALAVECRADDTETIERLKPLVHVPTLLATEAERAFLRKLEGGCSVPAGVYTHYNAEAGTLDFEVKTKKLLFNNRNAISFPY